MTTDFNALHTRLERLERDNATMQADNAQLQVQFQQAVRRYDSTQRRMRVQACLVLAALTTAVFLSPASRTAMAQGYGVTLAALNTRLTTLENKVANLQLLQGPKGDKGDPGPQGPSGTFDGIARVAALEAKTQYMSVDTPTNSVTFSGCNLILNNGLGATNGNPTNPHGSTGEVNGLGNLIIGYNAEQGNSKDVRTGSHNLIVGDQNNYSSFGGIVAGQSNSISAAYASVTGGFGNMAIDLDASVSGGARNTASGTYSSISGGIFNRARNSFSSISGGSGNTASGNSSSVSGGHANTASGGNSSVSGGDSNVASGFVAAVSGGFGVTQNNQYGWATAGFHVP